MTWHPSSWRAHPARQQPEYPDQHELEIVQSCLASSPSLVKIGEVESLRAQLAQVALGRGFLLQGGDCAETFAEFGPDKVRLTFNLLLDLAARIRNAAHLPVVKVARIAGQFAKPRSQDTESNGDTSLPVYRGDIVNGSEFTAAARTPDPMRMLEAHRQSRVTIDLMKAYAAAAYAPLSDLHRAGRDRIGLAAEHALPPGDVARPVEIYTSHEALLLPYEQALTHHDAASGRYWSGSAHMLWVGDRTRQADGAHVEYLRGIANPIGVKCGPGMDADGLLRLLEILDPHNEAGRIVLIGRFGAGAIGEHLPALMRATAMAGSNAIWASDPMHGNGQTIAGRKTRRVSDIRAEVASFFAIARAEGVHPGGIHLELTGEDVTECVGGTRSVEAADLSRRYITQCDPRLNPAQAADVAAEVVRRLTEVAQPEAIPA